jgi:hypothetical protein
MSFVRVFTVALLVVTSLDAQDAVVSRNVNLRDDPSSATPAIRLLYPGAELLLLDGETTDGYYHVLTMAGEEGWVYAARILLLPEEPPSPDEVFNDCPMEGNARRADIRALNILKNRTTAPTQITTVALRDILAPGDDETRFSESMGVRVTGYVFAVKPGSGESVNCGANDPEFKDAHIELTLNASDTLETERFVVEVTPKWRAFMAEQGEDWSNAALRARLQGRCAEFTGWMFWDKHHRRDAEHTDAGAGDNWRATAWEIHPVTGVRVVPCPS